MLRGNAGIDTINGNSGNDTIAGGAGNDSFVFKEGLGNDRITDFDANPGIAGGAGQDVLDVSAFDLTGTDLGTKIFVAYGGGIAIVTIDLDGAGGNPANGTITLTGASGAGTSAVTVDDFRFL